MAADALGIAFQLVDDLLDYVGTEATGKRIGDDFRERKLTLPVIKAIKLADDNELVFWKKCIGSGKQEAGDLDLALTIMHHHSTLDETRAQALFWANKAKAALAIIPEHQLKNMLIDLSDYVVARIN